MSRICAASSPCGAQRVLPRALQQQPGRAPTQPAAAAGSSGGASSPTRRMPERDRARRDDADRRARRDDLRDLRRAPAQQRAPRRALLVDDEARAELDDERRLHRCCVPSPTTRYWRSQRSRYVTGPRGPGTRSTLMPGLGRAGEREAVGEPRRRVPERGRAAVRRRGSARPPPASSVTIVAARPDVSSFASATASSSDVDDAHRDRRDVLGVVRPLVPDPLAARAPSMPSRSSTASSAGSCASAARSTSSRFRRLQTPSRSRLASTSALGHRRDPRRRRCRGRRRPRACASVRTPCCAASRASAAVVSPLPRRITSGSTPRQRDEHHARPRARASARGRPPPAAGPAPASAGRSTSSTSTVTVRSAAPPVRSTAAFEALQQLSGDVDRDVRPRLEVRADGADRDAAQRDLQTVVELPARPRPARAAAARRAARAARRARRCARRRGAAGRARPRRARAAATSAAFASRDRVAALADERRPRARARARRASSVSAPTGCCAAAASRSTCLSSSSCAHPVFRSAAEMPAIERSSGGSAASSPPR